MHILGSYVCVLPFYTPKRNIFMTFRNIFSSHFVIHTFLNHMFVFFDFTWVGIMYTNFVYYCKIFSMSFQYFFTRVGAKEPASHHTTFMCECILNQIYGYWNIAVVTHFCCIFCHIFCHRFVSIHQSMLHIFVTLLYHIFFCPHINTHDLPPPHILSLFNHWTRFSDKNLFCIFLNEFSIFCNTIWCKRTGFARNFDFFEWILNRTYDYWYIPISFTFSLHFSSHFPPPTLPSPNTILYILVRYKLSLNVHILKHTDVTIL